MSVAWRRSCALMGNAKSRGLLLGRNLWGLSAGAFQIYHELSLKMPCN